MLGSLAAKDLLTAFAHKAGKKQIHFDEDDLLQMRV